MVIHTAGSPTCPLHMDGNLEDFAGNTLRRVFDTDLTTLTADSPQLMLPVQLLSGS